MYVAPSRGIVRLGWDVANQIAAAVVLLVLSPLLIAIALWIRIADGKGVFFVQDRAGRDGVPFRMLKFRTMVHNAVAMSEQFGLHDPFGLVDNDPRITRCGKFLRRTSMDELPQLINVLRGDMCLVGPRPDVLPHVELYSAQDRRRLAVKPGITGWAQINGRNLISWPERFVLDGWYVDHWSPVLDLKIIWHTWAALRRAELDSPWAKEAEAAQAP